MNENFNLDGIFYIVRGQYKRKEPKFFNSADQDYSYIGGYNPEDSENPEWYMLMDNISFRTHRTGNDLNFVAEGVKDLILKYKTKENLEKALSGVSNKKSKIQHQMDLEIYKTYGDYFSDLVEEKEREALKILFGKKKISPKIKKVKPKIRKKESEEISEKEIPKKVSEEKSGKRMKIKCIKRERK